MIILGGDLIEINMLMFCHFVSVLNTKSFVAHAPMLYVCCVPVKNTPVKERRMSIQSFNVKPVENWRIEVKIENCNMFGDFVSQ